MEENPIGDISNSQGKPQAESPGAPEIKEKEKTSVRFLRHAPTQWSKEHIVQGTTDTDIAAEKPEAYLKKAGARDLPKPDLIVVSGLKRTQQTAGVLIGLLGWPDIQTISDPAFNERRWGNLQGKTHEQVRSILENDPSLLEKYPYLKDGEFERIWSDPKFKVEGSESLNELAIRVKLGMIGLNERFPGKNILLIAHAGVLQTQGLDLGSISEMSVGKSQTGDSIIRKVE